MRFLLPLTASRLTISAAAMGLLSLTAPSYLHAQQPVIISQGVPGDAGPTPVTCVRYLNARESEAVLPGSSLAIRDGEIRIQAGGQVQFRIPSPVTRAQLMRRNGQRPGVDYQYSTDQASTGTGFYWFASQYPEGATQPDVLRNELFIDGSGQIVSYTFFQKRQQADPATGSRESTIRCEPPRQ